MLLVTVPDSDARRLGEGFHFSPHREMFCHSSLKTLSVPNSGVFTDEKT
jgi:hypothetical protein